MINNWADTVDCGSLWAVWAREDPLEHGGNAGYAVQTACCAAHLCVHTVCAASTVRARPLIHRHAATRPLGQEVNTTLCVFAYLKCATTVFTHAVESHTCNLMLYFRLEKARGPINSLLKTIFVYENKYKHFSQCLIHKLSPRK